MTELTEIPAPPAAMIDAIVTQFEAGLLSMKVPDYVEKAARDFIAALKKWSGGA